MTLNKKDFIEIDFTGKVKGGEVFDSTIKEDLEKLHEGHDHPIEVRPFVFALGEGMFLKSIDDFLIGKDIGKYELELKPEQAFGKRNPSLVQMVPLKMFRDHQVNPVPGGLLNFDGRVGKTLTVSGGRVMIDFNNPLSGKDVVYKIEVKRKVTDINEKVRALNDFLFKRDFDFEIKDKALILKVEKGMKSFIEMFKEKFEEILGLDLEVLETEKSEKTSDISDKKTD
ncbi:MAG: peptidylprolyl isomerase [Candidatus Pacearchaeota archaeon]|jgi:FKBP-type peptidyl-prolyl cis-trans isomerase 2